MPAIPPHLGTTLFIYGTLKRGYTNYDRYLSHAVAREGAQCLGSATTTDAFHLVIHPERAGHGGTRAPAMMELDPNNLGCGFRVAGEVFAVDDRALAGLDILEGVHDGRYYKREVQATLEDGSSVQAFAYFFQPNEELWVLPAYATYDDEMHSLYKPHPIEALNPAILANMLPPEQVAPEG